MAFLRSVPMNTSGLAVEVLLTEPMVVAIPRGHSLSKHAAGAAVAMRDLQNEPFIVFARQHGPAFYDSTLAACQRAGFSPRIAQEAPRVTTALGLVAAGLGVCVVPASMRRIALDGVAVDRMAGTSGPTVRRRLRKAAAPCLRPAVCARAGCQRLLVAVTDNAKARMGRLLLAGSRWPRTAAS